MEKPELSVIIASYNTKPLLRDCLRSIYAAGPAMDFEVIVVDNSSEDGSYEMALSEFPKARVIKNSENLGFAYANNKGLNLAKGEYILFLNCDTKLVDSALEDMVAVARQRKKALGALGVGLYPSEEDQISQACYGRFPSIWRLLKWQTFLGGIFPFSEKANKVSPAGKGRLIKTDVISGACLFTSRKILEEVGPFDEGLFMYFEEFDLCRRIKKAGYEVYLCPDIRVVHYGNRSAQRPEFSQKKEAILKRSLSYYIKKHHGIAGHLVFHLMLKVDLLLRGLVKFARPLKKTFQGGE